MKCKYCGFEVNPFDEETCPDKPKEEKKEIFDNDKEMLEVIKLCEKFDWQIAIPSCEDQEAMIPGLVIGTAKYVDAVLDALEEKYHNESYENWNTQKVGE